MHADDTFTRVQIFPSNTPIRGYTPPSTMLFHITVFVTAVFVHSASSAKKSFLVDTSNQAPSVQLQPHDSASESEQVEAEPTMVSLARRERSIEDVSKIKKVFGSEQTRLPGSTPITKPVTTRHQPAKLAPLSRRPIRRSASVPESLLVQFRAEIEGDEGVGLTIATQSLLSRICRTRF